MKSYQFLLATAAVLAGFATAECPGGCSGNGVCGPRDMCSCFNNYMGNDCSMRICPFGFAHVDTPRGDLNMDRNQKTSGWILTRSQMYPSGGYEWFNPSAHTNEAHFYAECSNMGRCDRTTGLCECYPGFEGSGCQRAACPNNCNYHGVCKSIKEIAAQADRSNKLTGKGVGKVSTKYGKWDADIGHACVCDPGFTGPDCSRRQCKVGVDPLYLADAHAVYDTWNLYLAFVPASNAIDPTKSWARLRVFDYHGESYITDRIQINDYTNVDAGQVIKNALLKLPNKVISDVDCVEVVPAQTAAMDKLTNEVGFFVQCEFRGNPGQMRLPEVHSYQFATTNGVVQTSGIRAFVTATDRRGSDVDYSASLSPWAFKLDTSTQTLLNIQSTVSPSTLAPIAALSIIKIRDRVLLVASVTNTAGSEAITLKWPYRGSTFLDWSSIYYANDQTVAADTATIKTWNVGSDTFEVSATPTNLLKGSQIIYQNVFYYVRDIGTTSPYAFWVKVDRKFNGKAVDNSGVSTATDELYIVTTSLTPTASYKYVSECSGRGLCNQETGLCNCFKGYTNDNCDTQNILAF